MTRAHVTEQVGVTSVLGDVRWVSAAGDNDGYYRLDGRAAGALGGAAAAALATLGFAALPNAAGRSVRRSGPIGSTGGATTVTLAKANLPNVNLTGTIAASGAHAHGLNGPNATVYRNTGAAGPNFRPGIRGGTGLVRTVNAANNVHSHTFTNVQLGGGGQAVTLLRKSFAFRAAVCLDDSIRNTWLPIVGDIKHSLQTADHQGWVLLDGRPVATLTATQQAAAAALGIGANLPDVTDRTLKLQGAVYLTGGADSVVLTRANLPDVVLTAVTSTTSPNTHNHTLNEDQVLRGDISGQQDFSGQTIAGGNKFPNEGKPNIGADGAHTHPYSIPLGGSSTPIAVTMPYLSLATFLYLGT